MKKMVCLLLVVVLMLPTTIVSVFAVDSNSTLYKSVFEMEYGKTLYYNALCYYPIEIDEYYTEWVLIEAVTDRVTVDSTSDDYLTRGYINEDLVFYEKDELKPFNTSYCVYDVKYGEFIDITSVDFNKYDGLKEAVYKYNIATLIGDLDYDATVSVLDATEVQMIVAQLKPKRKDIAVVDVDCDGGVSILDSTAIQLKLAQID